MKLRLALVSVLILTSTAITSARAQLVHLSFEAEAGTGSYRLSGDRQMFYPWDTVGRGSLPAPLRLDLYYDLSSPQRFGGESGAAYGPLDPTRNFLRVRLEDPRVGKPFDIVQPLQDILVQETDLLALSLVQDASGYAEFEIFMGFQAPISENFALPSPPFPAFDPLGLPRFFLQGDDTLFGLEGLAEGSLSAGFDSMRAEIISDFTPVPEPSTYAMAAIIAIAAAVLLRQRRSLAAGEEQSAAA